MYSVYEQCTVTSSHTVCMELSVEFVFTPSRLCAGMLMLSSLGDMVFPNLFISHSSHHTGLEDLGWYVHIHMCILCLLAWYPGNMGEAWV